MQRITIDDVGHDLLVRAVADHIAKRFGDDLGASPLDIAIAAVWAVENEIRDCDDDGDKGGR